MHSYTLACTHSHWPRSLPNIWSKVRKRWMKEFLITLNWSANQNRLGWVICLRVVIEQTLLLLVMFHSRSPGPHSVYLSECLCVCLRVRTSVAGVCLWVSGRYSFWFDFMWVCCNLQRQSWRLLRLGEPSLEPRPPQKKNYPWTPPTQQCIVLEYNLLLL